MRHGVFGRKLNRNMAHRLALRRNLVQSLIEHGQVRTTITKGREVRRFAERLITLAIDGSLAAKQRANALLTDRAIIPKEHREAYERMPDAKRERVLRSRSGRRYRASTTRPGTPFTAGSVIHRLFADVGPRMKRRAEKLGAFGGYTRLIKLADRRIGDGTQLAVLQLVAEDDTKRAKLADKTERKRRAKARYSLYAGKTVQRRGQKRAAAAPKPEAEKPAGG